MMRCESGITPFSKNWPSVFEKGIKIKRFKRIADPFHLAVALDSFLDAFLLLWLDEPERHPYPEDPDSVLRYFLQGTD